MPRRDCEIERRRDLPHRRVCPAAVRKGQLDVLPGRDACKLRSGELTAPLEPIRADQAEELLSYRHHGTQRGCA